MPWDLINFAFICSCLRNGNSDICFFKEFLNRCHNDICQIAFSFGIGFCSLDLLARVHNQILEIKLSRPLELLAIPSA